MKVFIKKEGASTVEGKITKMFTYEGLERVETTSASSGEIVVIAGLPSIYIGETICENADSIPLPAICIDEPTISLNFLVNDSPFAGRDGKYVTGRQLRERLARELETNVGLKVDFSPETNRVGKTPYFKVYGRGELHIAILIENMRREGYELQVSQPQVIIKEDAGVKMEPFEEVIIDVKEKLSSSVIQTLSERRGQLLEMKEHGGNVRIIFEIPTRGLLGYRSQFIIDTKGEGILSSRFTAFKEYIGPIDRHSFGSMISMASGIALAYSLWNLQERGRIYVNPGTPVYEGMIIGNVTKGDNLDVNPTKNKQMTNVRNSGNDDAILLETPLLLTIERGMEIMAEDDFLEVTPKNVRLRKKYLRETDRTRAARSK